VAASAQGIRAGLAFVELGVRDSALNKGLKAAESKVRAWGMAMTSLGAKLLVAGGAVAAPLGMAVKMTASFEQSMARVKALTNAGAGDFQAMWKEAERLGATTVYTAAQAAQTMGVFALSGMQANDIIAATGPTLDLAATGMMDLAAAADISMKVMKGMGLTTAELPRVVDVLAKAMTTANTDLVMLGDAFKYVGPVAKAAGMSFEETTAAIQMLSDAGMQGDMAGTTLRGAILSLTSPSQEAIDKMLELGIATKDARGNFLSLAAIIGQFEKALAGKGTGDRLEAIGTIFANRQATGIAELVDQGAGSLRDKTKALFDVTGTSARIAATQLDTLYGSWMLLTSAIEGVAISVGQAVNPVLREWGEVLVGVTGAVRQWADANPELWRTLSQVVGVVVVAGGAILSLGVALQMVSFALGGFSFILTTLAVAAGIWFSPLFLLVRWLATIPLVTGVGRDAMNSFGKAAGDALSWVGEQFRWLGGVVGTTWGGMMAALKSGDLALAGQIGMQGLQVVWDGVIGNMMSAWDGFIGYFVDAWEKATMAVARLINRATFQPHRTGMDFNRFVVENFGWMTGSRDAGREAVLDARTIIRGEEKAVDDEIVAEYRRGQNARDRARAAADAARRDRLTASQAELDRLIAQAIMAPIVALIEDVGEAVANATTPSVYETIAAVGGAAIAAGGGRRLPTGGELGEAMGRATGSSAGTFNASAIRGLVGRDTAAVEQLKAANEKLKRMERLERLLDQIERNTGEGMRFA